RLFIPVSGEDADFIADEGLDSVFRFKTGCGVLSSTIGAGRRCAVRNSRQQTKQSRATVRMSILRNFSHGTMKIFPETGSLAFEPEGSPRTSNNRVASGSNGL